MIVLIASAFEQTVERHKLTFRLARYMLGIDLLKTQNICLKPVEGWPKHRQTRCEVDMRLGAVIQTFQIERGEAHNAAITCKPAFCHLTGIKVTARFAGDDARPDRNRLRENVHDDGQRPEWRSTMYKHILIATDGSDLAQRAVEQGLGLAKLAQAKVTVVTVTEPWTAAVSGEWAVAFPVEEYEKASAANAAKVLEGVQKTAASLGVTCDGVHVQDQYPAEGIVEEAKARDCDLIVMSSHGRRGIAKFVLGSQATRVLAHTSVPLLICR